MSNWYRPGVTAISRSTWLSDTLAATLHTSSYVPNPDTDTTVAALTNELAAGNGYATGGVTLTSKTAAYLTAAQWGLSPVVSTAVVAGAMMQTGGSIHRCITAGTTAATAPTYATAIGSTTTDGTATWMCEGTGSMIWTASTAYPSGYLVRPTAGNGNLYRCAVAGTSGATAPTWPTVAGQSVTDGGATWECLGGGVTIYAAANPSWSGATFTGAQICVLRDVTAAVPLGYTNYGSGQSGQGGVFTDMFNAEGCLFVGAA